MERLLSSLGIDKIKGDHTLWGIVIFISMLSLMPVYSASSNLEYTVNQGTTTSHMFKHLGFVIVGIGLMWLIQFIRYEYLSRICLLALWIFVPLLAYTSFFGGQTIEGASASRWLKVPFIGIKFQPSFFSYILLIIYLCRYIVKFSHRDYPWWKHALYAFGPILLIFLLVAKDNGSTALMIFGSSVIVLILGGFSWKYILGFVSIIVASAGIFLLIAMNTNLIQNNRVDTWKSRIEVHLGISEESEATLDSKNYQIRQAKAALVHGGFTGKGPGKSAMKQALPQSASDFIFAIVVEEYGFFGGSFLLLLYSIILIRIIIIANKVPTFFGSLLVLSMGVILFVQIIVNIAVTLDIIPVTGQPLPLISYGGTAMLSIYFLLGIVLNVSKGAQILDEEGLTSRKTLNDIDDIA